MFTHVALGSGHHIHNSSYSIYHDSWSAAVTRIRLPLLLPSFLSPSPGHAGRDGSRSLSGQKSLQRSSHLGHRPRGKAPKKISIRQWRCWDRHPEMNAPSSMCTASHVPPRFFSRCTVVDRIAQVLSLLESTCCLLGPGGTRRCLRKRWCPT